MAQGVLTTVVIGPTGAGATRDAESMGFIFPVQAHSLAAVAGEWEFMESGVNEYKAGEHFVGKMTIAADGKITVCDYDVMANNFTTCEVDTDEAIKLEEQSGGYFTLNYGQSSGPVFGFRAPNGTLTLFGVNDEVNAQGQFRTLFVFTQPQTATSQPVGTVSKYWDIQQVYKAPVSPIPDGTRVATLSSDEVTITALRRLRTDAHARQRRPYRHVPAERADPGPAVPCGGPLQSPA